MSVGRMVGEDSEEMEGFIGMVPEAFENLVDKLWGPMESRRVEDLG